MSSDTDPDVYLSLRMLPHGPYAYVVRQPGRTLLIADPRATRMQIVTYSLDNLTRAECNAYRAAYGLPPVGQPAEDFEIEGDAFLYVPPGLRLAGEPAIQGGAELQRRADEGTLDDETAALHAECARADALAGWQYPRAV